MENTQATLNIYKLQLKQIDDALLTAAEGEEKTELLVLKNNILELLSLMDGEDADTSTEVVSKNNSNSIDDEYALFMAEMEREGVVNSEEKHSVNTEESNTRLDISEDYKSLEGMKCRAPFKHQWGDTVYHNAMICSVISDDTTSYQDVKVKVLFINPTHQEMLPCPYYLETDCKFTEDKCRYSHGETVAFTDLQEYVEPRFDNLSTGSLVLAKRTDKLWYRARVKRVYTAKCLVRFESNQKSSEVDFEHLIPLESNENCDNESVNGSSDSETQQKEDVINMSLLNSPSDQALGSWEKHTKGIGSKLMEKMGYIIGTGLGRNNDGRIDPVLAVILPAGKSLDHCMKLRECAGGDKNLFSAERKLKRLQRRQEILSQRVYEREKKKVDVFNFLNETLSTTSKSQQPELCKTKHRQEIRKETSRNLNVASLKTDEDIKRVERDLYKIEESLTRHTNQDSPMHKNLQQQMAIRKNELNVLHAQASNIKNEQSLRTNKKKMTIF